MKKLFIVSMLVSGVAVAASPALARAQQEVGRDVTVWTWDGRINSGNWFYLHNVNGAVNPTALQGAINSAISATGINTPSSTVSMLKAFPNPARDKFEVQVGLAKSAQVSIQMFGMEGNLVAEIHNGWLAAGEH